MSKKHKNKFHKRIRAQLLEEMSRGERKITTPQPPAAITSPASHQPYSGAPQNILATATPAAPALSPTDESLAYLKKDLKKSAIIISTIIVLIVALAIVDQKTNLLLQFGDFVFRVLHISQ